MYPKAGIKDLTLKKTYGQKTEEGCKAQDEEHSR